MVDHRRGRACVLIVRALYGVPQPAFFLLGALVSVAPLTFSLLGRRFFLRFFRALDAVGAHLSRLEKTGQFETLVRFCKVMKDRISRVKPR